MLRIAIVEDEELNRVQIKEYIDCYAREQKLEIQVSEFKNGEAVLSGYNRDFDIILLDIELPGINGMEVARRIREVDEDVVLVFITNMAQYAIDGYSVGALDFVLKPINYYTFSLKLGRAIKRVQVREDKDIILNVSNGMKRLKVSQIYYVDIQNRILHYHTSEGEFLVRGTLQAAEEELARYHFVKCNHWYLVNLKYVTEISDNLVTVAGNTLEISRRNKNAFMNAVTNYVGGNT